MAHKRHQQIYYISLQLYPISRTKILMSLTVREKIHEEKIIIFILSVLNILFAWYVSLKIAKRQMCPPKVVN